jgi:hypothetical protein
MSSKDINLDGGEISILKALGLGGTEVEGEVLLERVPQLEAAEVIDVLQGLTSLGFVDADNAAFHSLEEMKKVKFRVNSGYSKDLREALDPKAGEKPKSRRVRRE